jgi:hypothetical protein
VSERRRLVDAALMVSLVELASEARVMTIQGKKAEEADSRQAEGRRKKNKNKKNGQGNASVSKNKIMSILSNSLIHTPRPMQELGGGCTISCLKIIIHTLFEIVDA